MRANAAVRPIDAQRPDAWTPPGMAAISCSTDGATTRLVGDLFDGAGSSNIRTVTTVGDKVFFQANDCLVEELVAREIQRISRK